MTDASRIIVGLSGGVDSAVAAGLLKQSGHDVSAIFMKNWEEDDAQGECPADADFRDAELVCDILDIPLHQVNFAKNYWDEVFENFLTEYQAGRTPNPDILCNKEIKFKAFLNYARTLGADAIATGHYAQIGNVGGHYQLLKGNDSNKDQSYFLYTLGQQQLAHSCFPIGHLSKPQVRELAQQMGLANHAKRDSTGICFIGERDFKEFLQQYLPAQPGPIVDENGAVLGEHHGLMYYTLGQRQGLGIGGQAQHDDAPWYVAHKNLSDNTLLVVQGHDHPALHCQRLRFQQASWVAGTPPDFTRARYAKIRYRQADQACTLSQIDADTFQADFAQPQRAVTPGQSIVIYDDVCCLGGGIIHEAW